MTNTEFRNRFSYNLSADFLGEGSYGRVYRATDTKTRQTVAIKVAPVDSRDHTYSLKNEFDTLAKVADHPHISFYDQCYRFEVEPVGVYDFAIMDFFPLGSLDKVLRERELSLSDKKDIALGILKGLKHLHESKLIHRDLKPGNILVQQLRGRYIAKIADFGLGKFAEQGKTNISQSFKGGTFNYASPEQLKGEKVRFNTDIWSFGVILFELFTKEIPFRISDYTDSIIAQTYQRMLQQEFPSVFRTIPEPYASLIKACLVVEPSHRLSDIEDAFGVLEGRPFIPPTPPSPKPLSEDTIIIPKKEPVILPPPPDPPKPPVPQENPYVYKWFIGAIVVVLLLLVIKSISSPDPRPYDETEYTAADTTTVAVDTAGYYDYAAVDTAAVDTSAAK